MCIHCISDPNLFTHFSNPTFDTLLHVDIVTHADSLSVSLYIYRSILFILHPQVGSFFLTVLQCQACVCVCERGHLCYGAACILLKCSASQAVDVQLLLMCCD